MTDTDLDAIEARANAVYAAVHLSEMEERALTLLDSGVVDDLVAEVRRLREEAEVDAGLIRSIIAAREHVERTLTAERDDARAAIARVRALDPADHATSSRDYGRGYAQAIRDIRAALDGTA